MVRPFAAALAAALPAWLLAAGCTVFLDFDEPIVDAAPAPDAEVPDADPNAPDAPPDPTMIFEPNETPETAVPIAIGTTYGPLAISPMLDRDYFKINLDVAKDVVIDCSFVHGQGDLDLALYDATMTKVGQSQSNDDNEQIVKSAAMANQLGPGDYFIEVYSFQNSQTNLSYQLLVSTP